MKKWLVFVLLLCASFGCLLLSTWAMHRPTYDDWWASAVSLFAFCLFAALAICALAVAVDK